ncbi:MAG: DUF1593 domain-containing protein [Rhodothermales bacterium]|nr:DUF1593 domain-containing protein [Rhodothermales bacterium]
MRSQVFFNRLFLPGLFALILQPATAQPQPYDPATIDTFAGRPRLFVLTDMGNEPDDQMSMVRLLVYANEIDIEGLVATTSTWQRTRTNPHTIRDIVASYGEVRSNLLLHAPGWPEAAALDALVVSGQPAYGMAAVGSDQLSAGAEALIRAGDKPDNRPLWVSVWGGANTLAQALLTLRETRTPEQVEAFVRKLRVYSISDQDDAGSWIRREFPGLFYIVEPSPQDASAYYYATWTGIAGDIFYRNGAGADSTLISNAWLETHIRAKGPLGAHYLRFDYIMEGDTPAYLGLTNNGLNSYRNPSWGGWSGRYIWTQPHGETHPIWSQGGDLTSRVTSQDEVVGVDGKTYISDHATIWRWRAAYQNDFAARMDWSVQPFTRANHPPAIVINSALGAAPLYLDARVGEEVVLDARPTSDPDAHPLRYRWFHYLEAGYTPGQGMAAVSIAGANTACAVVTPTAACRPNWLATNRACAEGIAHIILEVTDGGTPALTRYKRVVLRVRG